MHRDFVAAIIGQRTQLASYGPLNPSSRKLESIWTVQDFALPERVVYQRIK